MNPNIIRIEDPFPYLKIENLYDDNELELIWQELEFLNYPTKLDLPEKIGGSTTSSSKHGLFLDDLYRKREISNILKVNRKIFSDAYFDAYASLNFAYVSLKYTNHDKTLISYYDNGDYYKAHADDSVHSILTWFFKEPKAFWGGNLNFIEYNHCVEIKNNMTIIFPGFVAHEVDEIIMKDKVPYGYGRYCMTQFTTFI